MTTMRHLIDIVELAPFRAVVAHLTTENTGGIISIAELRRQVFTLISSWRGEVFHNVETDRDITIVGSGVKKTTQCGETLLRMHYALPNILRNGTFINVEEPRAHRPGAIDVLTIGASVMLNERLYHIVAKIRKYPATGNHHYSLHFDCDFDIVLVDASTGF